MRPSVEALPGDSNAAVTVVSTDAANENMSNQEMDKLCPMSCANVVGPSSGAVSVR